MILKKSPGQKAARHAGRAIGALDTIVSDLNEANRLLDDERDALWAKHDAHIVASQEHAALAVLHADAAFAVNDDQARHSRIIARVAALTS